MRLVRIAWILALAVPASAQFCFAEWTKTVVCPPDRVYRDVRKDGGREEFCEHLLPGSLKVNDGPYRFWFNESLLGSQGSYQEGRQVGPWKECDRFGRCRQSVYEPADGAEKQRKSFKPELPFSFAHGKYVFDFASCRTTWVMDAQDQPAVELNIYGMQPYRCQVTFIAHEKEEYLCRIPFAVGIQELDSLDLRNELLKLGLPQFCRPPSTTGEAFMVTQNGSDVATTIDIECAATELDSTGRELLTIKLNPYAARLVSEAARQNPIKTLVAFEELGERKPVIDSGGRTFFVYSLSTNSATAKKEKERLAAAIAVKPSCR